MISFPGLMTRGEDWNKLVNWELHLQTKLRLPRPVWIKAAKTTDGAPIHLSISHTLPPLVKRTRDTWTLSLGAATQSEPVGSNPPLTGEDTWPPPHPKHFTLGCKPPQCVLEVTDQWSKKTTSLAKSRYAILRSPNKYKPSKPVIP